LAIVAASGYLLGLVLHTPLLCLVSKPVPALALAWIAFRAGSDLRPRAIAGGLLLSALGDVLLELRGLFVAGLSAFLLAHLAYTAAFLSDERRLRLARALPFALWLGTGAALFWSGVGPLAVPVAVYMTAIGAMMWRAAARVDPDRTGALTGLAGAMLFGLSDTLLALDRFRAPIGGVRYAIILLYWAGQAGIALSVVQPPAPANARA
jgi:alkenylglycerophosphocholine/alkenylglycerophosphoethanolamine hydrolase